MGPQKYKERSADKLLLGFCEQIAPDGLIVQKLDPVLARALPRTEVKAIRIALQHSLRRYLVRASTRSVAAKTLQLAGCQSSMALPSGYMTWAKSPMPSIAVSLKGLIPAASSCTNMAAKSETRKLIMTC